MFSFPLIGEMQPRRSAIPGRALCWPGIAWHSGSSGLFSLVNSFQRTAKSLCCSKPGLHEDQAARLLHYKVNLARASGSFSRSAASCAVRETAARPIWLSFPFLSRLMSCRADPRKDPFRYREPVFGSAECWREALENRVSIFELGADQLPADMLVCGQ